MLKSFYIFITKIIFITIPAIGLCTDASLRFELSIEGMYFLNDSDVSGQDNASASATFQPKYTKKWDFGKKIFDMHLFARADANDSNRTYADIRELSWYQVVNNFEYKIGVSIEHWGVVESYPVVDIINQKNYLESLDFKDRLGQPMAKLSYLSDWGTFSGWILPYFRERMFASSDSRAFSVQIPVDDDEALFYSSNEERHIDLALRYSNSYGDIDFGLSYFDGTQRDPVLTYDAGSGTLIPFYDLVKQISTDAQWTGDALLLKLEALYRDEATFGDSTAAVYGFEYTIFNLFRSHDLGLITEVLYDGRGKTRTSFDNDIFLGTRYTLNNIDDTNILIGGFVDLDDGTRAFRAKLESRIASNWKYELIIQTFDNVSDDDLYFSGIKNDDFIRLNLRYYF